ncbi:MAG: trehalose-phosphatase [Dehalococcoidia bacterium]
MLTLDVTTRLRELAHERKPLLVATDLDGTLAPIVADAAEARVPPAALAVLDRLARAAKVAVITGRDLNTARRMVPCDEVVIMGSHGLEASIERGLLPEADRMHLAAALEKIEQHVISRVPSAFVHIERKAISTAFHFRKAPELEGPLRAALKTLPKGLKLREGRMVLEVLPDERGGKDVALLALARHFKAKSVFVMGDDLTDVAMFRAALKLRDEGLPALLVGVSGHEETPPQIAELADFMVHSTDEAQEALETMARALGV